MQIKLTISKKCILKHKIECSFLNISRCFKCK